MRDPFDVKICRAAAEKLFGRAFASFKEVRGGNTSQNFVAALGDERWFVKVGHPKRVQLTVSRHLAVKSALVPKIAMDGRIGSCEDRAVCAEEWFEGIFHVDPADLTSDQVNELVQAYRAFLTAAKAVKDAKDYGDVKGSEADGTLSVIHGDLNFRNVAFKGGHVLAILDLESMRLGYPTEDLLEFVVHEMERTRIWFRRRLHKLERSLAELVRASGYTCKAWLAAVDIYVTRKQAKRQSKARFPLLKSLAFRLRAPLYATIRRIIERDALPC